MIVDLEFTLKDFDVFISEINAYSECTTGPPLAERTVTYGRALGASLYPIAYGAARASTFVNLRQFALLCIRSR
jgi:hypothetical protein